MKNVYNKVVEDFGEEWSLYNYSEIKDAEILFNKYFDIFPWESLDAKKFKCIDIGCGTGRWSKILSKKVGHITLLEPSHKALNVAKKNLRETDNVSFINQSIESMNYKENTFDFVFSLGVLHHIKDIKVGLQNINKILKKDSPFLIYIYYNLENKNMFYRIVWKITDIIRKIISYMPLKIKKVICYLIALFVYFPLAKFNLLLKVLKISTFNIPLAEYSQATFYNMKVDSLDRFGTKIENRYSKKRNERIINK